MFTTRKTAHGAARCRALSYVVFRSVPV